MEYDGIVVGAGPAGLLAAIRLKQPAGEQGRELSVCVLEKGSEPGAHILSGAIMDPRALGELIPDWAERGAPLRQPVTEDDVRAAYEQEIGTTGAEEMLTAHILVDSAERAQEVLAALQG